MSLAWLVVVLDQLGLDVFCQSVIIFRGPMSQDAGRELVLGVAGSAEDHLHHLLTGSGTDRYVIMDRWTTGMLPTVAYFSLRS